MLEEYVTEAIQMVSAWDIADEDFAQTVNDHARLMAGYQPDDPWPDTH